MKKLFKILFIAVFLTAFSLSYADSSKQAAKTESDQTGNLPSESDKGSKTSGKKLENSNKIDEKAEQKSETGWTQKEEQAKIIKSLNNILIESYKAKFSKILGDLNFNIKDKKKEEKLKILSTVLVSIKVKIDLINSDKIQISDNRKEILIALLVYIKQDVENKIQTLAKEK